MRDKGPLRIMRNQGERRTQPVMGVFDASPEQIHEWQEADKTFRQAADLWRMGLTG